MKRELNIESVYRLIKEHDLTTSCRQNEYLFKRCILYYYLYNDLQWTYARIGKLFNKNHATVLSGLRRYYKLCDEAETYPEFKEDKSYIEREIFVLTETVDVSQGELTLFERVMKCENYYEMRLIQEELKKQLETLRN